MLNTEQQNLLDLLAAGGHAWVDLSSSQRQLLSETLRPESAFTAEQRVLLADWYLLITPEQLVIANTILAPTARAITSRITIDERLVTNADLLTDMRIGDTYYTIASLLVTLKLIKIEASMFSQPTEAEL
jgi:hypothetical protein